MDFVAVGGEGAAEGELSGVADEVHGRSWDVGCGFHAPCDGEFAGGACAAGDAEAVVACGEVFFPDVFEIVDGGVALVDGDGRGAVCGEEFEGEVEVDERVRAWSEAAAGDDACDGAVPDDEGGEFCGDGAWLDGEAVVGGGAGCEGVVVPCFVRAWGGLIGELFCA